MNAALDSTLGFVAVHDVDGTVRYVSPNVTAVLGHAPQDLTGPMPTHLVHPDDRDTVIENDDACARVATPSRDALFPRRAR